MSIDASINLEQSLAHTEADALETLAAVKELLRPLRRLRLAAETGNLTQIDKSIAAAQTAWRRCSSSWMKPKRGGISMPTII